MITSTNHYVFTYVFINPDFIHPMTLFQYCCFFGYMITAMLQLFSYTYTQSRTARVTLCQECRHNPVLSKHMLIGWLNHYQAGSPILIDNRLLNTVIHTSGSLSHPKMNAGCDHLPEGGNMPSCSGSLVLSSVHMLINLEVIFPITLFQYGCYLVT